MAIRRQANFGFLETIDLRAITYQRYGGPEVLELAEVERPEPGDNELLIETRAAEVTKADC